MTAKIRDLLVLTDRETQRLKHAQKQLSHCHLEQPALNRMAKAWQQLGYTAYQTPVQQTLNQLIQDLDQGQYSQEAYHQLSLQLHLYIQLIWQHLDQRLSSEQRAPYFQGKRSLQPSAKQAFQQAYEPNKRLSVQQQTQRLQHLVNSLPEPQTPDIQHTADPSTRILALMGIPTLRDTRPPPDNLIQFKTTTCFPA